MIKYIIGAVLVLLMVIGSAIITSMILSGLLMFGSIVFITESIKPLKWLMRKLANFVDILMFIIGFIMLVKAGVIAAMGVGVCGIMYTVFYKPYLLNPPVKKSNLKY